MAKDTKKIDTRTESPVTLPVDPKRSPINAKSPGVPVPFEPYGVPGYRGQVPAPLERDQKLIPERYNKYRTIRLNNSQVSAGAISDFEIAGQALTITAFDLGSYWNGAIVFIFLDDNPEPIIFDCKGQSVPAIPSVTNPVAAQVGGRYMHINGVPFRKIRVQIFDREPPDENSIFQLALTAWNDAVDLRFG